MKCKSVAPSLWLFAAIVAFGLPAIAVYAQTGTCNFKISKYVGCDSTPPPFQCPAFQTGSNCTSKFERELEAIPIECEITPSLSHCVQQYVVVDYCFWEYNCWNDPDQSLLCVADRAAGNPGTSKPIVVTSDCDD